MSRFIREKKFYCGIEKRIQRSQARSIAGSKEGGRQGRASPSRSNFFDFHAVLVK